MDPFRRNSAWLGVTLRSHDRRRLGPAFRLVSGYGF